MNTELNSRNVMIYYNLNMLDLQRRSKQQGREGIKIGGGVVLDRNNEVMNYMWHWCDPLF